MKVIKLTLNNEYMSSNCYLLVKGNDVCIIDPGFEDMKLYSYLKENNLNIKQIVLTHGHYDHWIGLEHLLKLYPNTPLLASSLDEYWFLKNPFTKYKPQINIDLNGLDEIKLLDDTFKIIKTPGHSLGSVSFYNEGILIVGDVLFKNSVGRTDLYGGSFNELLNSINKLLKLPLSTTVYSGHGNKTTLNEELKNNPFLK